MSQQSIPMLPLTIAASGAVSANTFIGWTGATLDAGTTSKVMGVARTDAVDGDAVTVDTLGTAIVIASGAISAGGAIEVDADGKAKASAGTNPVVARALQAATADGDLIEIFVLPA